MAPSNAAILTRQSKAWAHKKRARQGQLKEVVFDEEARRDYLTGFQKRNAEKKKAAKAKAVEREKAEHLEERRQMRKEMKERARTNFEAVEKAYGGAALEMLEEGSAKPGENEHEEEFSDDEQLATVAVIEDFDPTADMHGPSRENNDAEEVDGEAPPSKQLKGKSKDWSTPVKRPSKPKPTTRKVRYETKAAARAAHAKALAQRRGKKTERISKKRSKSGKR
ncbi:nucleolar protein 12, 25 kDa protein [Ceratobasidium sp. AG-Ba]|nr:nucleolar protein 12, 25 kDa protein [Ceratobasidium sp. AG-Ba]